ncbi:MAG: JAB domain-containing protein, partial [Nitrospirota bacterium]
RLRQAGDLLGITVLDHIILGDDHTYSFADRGWPT